MTKSHSDTAPRPRTNYHHGDLARELVQASLDILGEVGAEGLSLREAARRVGVNHRAVYRHFADKRALLAAIAESGYRQLSADMRAAVASIAAPPLRAGGGAARAAESRRAAATGPRERATLLAIAEAYLRFALREPARFQVMFGPRLNQDDAFPQLEVVIRETVDILARELKLAGPSAGSAVRRDAGISLWSTMHGLSSLVLARRIPLKPALVHSYATKVVGPVVDGLLHTLAG